MKFIIQSIKDAFSNFGRNKLANYLCLGIIAFTLLVLGIFNYISYNLNNYINRFSQNIEAIFYFHENVRLDEIENFTKTLKESLLVKSVGFTSRETAKRNFSQEFPELKYILSEFATSPFPASVEVTFITGDNIQTKVISFTEEMEKIPVIQSVQLNLDWARKVAVVKKFISIIGYFLSFILIFVSVFIIFNVIKLNIFYRKEEINIFRLVGATNWYIRTPFMIEGSLLGFFGGAVAGLLLLVILKIFPFYAEFIFNIVKQMIDFRVIPLRIIMRLIITGTLIGLFSSILSVKRYFR